MGDWIPKAFPFAIAVVLPPAGLILGFAAMQENRDLGLRVMAVAVLAAFVWGLLFLSCLGCRAGEREGTALRVAADGPALPRVDDRAAQLAHAIRRRGKVGDVEV